MTRLGELAWQVTLMLVMAELTVANVTLASGAFWNTQWQFFADRFREKKLQAPNRINKKPLTEVWQDFGELFGMQLLLRLASLPRQTLNRMK